MKKTVVINVVGLTKRLIGEHTPFIKSFLKRGQASYIEPVLPAVTCSVQSTYVTGKWPTDHGIVGNGWYFKDECEVKFWRQSNKLVQQPKIWDDIKKKHPNFTCANHFGGTTCTVMLILVLLQDQIIWQTAEKFQMYILIRHSCEMRCKVR